MQKMANADMLLGSIDGWGSLIMNWVSSLRSQMIKTYLPASNDALLHQKVLQLVVDEQTSEYFSLFVK